MSERIQVNKALLWVLADPDIQDRMRLSIIKLCNPEILACLVELFLNLIEANIEISDDENIQILKKYQHFILQIASLDSNLRSVRQILSQKANYKKLPIILPILLPRVTSNFEAPVETSAVVEPEKLNENEQPA